MLCYFLAIDLTFKSMIFVNHWLMSYAFGAGAITVANQQQLSSWSFMQVQDFAYAVHSIR